MRSFTRRTRGPQRGAVMVEFALSILFTVLLIFMVFEMVSLVYTYSVLSDAAKEGVRYAIVHGEDLPAADQVSPTSTTGLINDVTDYAKMSLHDVSAITITPTFPDGNNDKLSRVQVTVTYKYVPYIVLPFTAPTITTTAEGRITY
jgi:Flp pilus assembly protein TadG